MFRATPTILLLRTANEQGELRTDSMFLLHYICCFVLVGCLNFPEVFCMDHHLFPNRSDVIENKDHCNESTIFGITAVTVVYLLCAIFGLLSVITVIGNLLVITAIIYFRQLHTPTHYLILSLAVADLLVGVFILPFSAVLIVNPCLYLQTFICRVRNSCDMFLTTTSILNLCFISVDRYHAVCQPLKYRIIITVRVTVGMIIVSWTLPVLIGIGITMNDPNRSPKRCLFFQNPSLLFLILGAVVLFYVPAVIILTTYLKILIVAQRQARSIKNTACLSRKPGDMLSKTERKATRTLSVVMGIFFICWTPFFLSLMLKPLSNNTIPTSLIDSFKWLGWSNSMLNPFVYAFFYSWFRSAFKMIISGQIFRGDFMNSKLF